MDLSGIVYLGFTVLLFLVFAAIVARTYSPGRKERGEEPKYRMMDED
ncbi:cbb3-type cytochrome c oxidase subunit 3 [Geomonas sp. Red32]|nr:cbb3-type cytochrome c oxidase subunit 3 [Geomonas sp. Red32]MCM0082355.1 cbb3-type cytochrome c oxidase subunit 3 [Geomonas sp. Red32]